MDCPITVECRKYINTGGERCGDYTIDAKERAISYRLDWPFFPAAFRITDNLRHIEATPAMLRLPYFLKYHNIDQLRQQLWQFNLIPAQRFLIHGAVWGDVPWWSKQQENVISPGVLALGWPTSGNWWSKQQENVISPGVLALGWPNSGKTTTIIKELRGGSRYCTDENAVIYGKTASPVARKSSLSRQQAIDAGIPLSLRTRLRFYWQEFLSRICPICEPQLFMDLPFDARPIAITELRFLQPGGLTADSDCRARAMLLLLDNEFPWFTNPVIQTYCYFMGIDIIKRYEGYKKLIYAFVNSIT